MCLVVDTPELSQANDGKASIGIDLGLKDFATLSNGEKIEAQRTYISIRCRLDDVPNNAQVQMRERRRIVR